jgi:hypothetical protein
MHSRENSVICLYSYEKEEEENGKERHDKAHKIDVIYHVRWKIKGP